MALTARPHARPTWPVMERRGGSGATQRPAVALTVAPARARRIGVRSRTTRGVLCIGVGVLTVAWLHVVFQIGGAPVESFISKWLYDIAFVADTVVCVAVGVRRRSTAWLVLGVGLASFSLGNLIYSLAPDSATVPIPSISDPLWLAIYPCEYSMLILLGRQRVGRVPLATRLDGLVGGLALAAALACMTLPEVTTAWTGHLFWQVATNLAYPVCDLVLLICVVSVLSAVSRTGHDRIWVVLAGSIIAWQVADVLFLHGVGGRVSDLADALVMTGGCGLAMASLLDTTPSPPRPARDASLVLPIGASAVALAVLALTAPLHLDAAAGALAAAALAVSLLRTALALRENRTMIAHSHGEATTDALTGLANMRKLRGDLAEIFVANLAPCVLIMLDLNGFKAYNDTFGHLAGDELLAGLASSLAACAGPEGVAYRMGGDEFCVLAPLTADPEALGLTCVSAMTRTCGKVVISAAHGLVRLPDEAADATSALALADERMYQDKRAR
jgi:two-component system cell cycle response regulator